MNGIEREITYTKDELNRALPAYGFVVVYLLALIPNDFRLIDSPVLLTLIISGRVFGSLVVISVIGAILVPRLRRWYGSLNMIAFFAMILLQPPILYTRPAITSYSLLPTLILMAVMFFLIPAPFSLKIFLALLLSSSDLSQMLIRGGLPPSEEWTFFISHLGLAAAGAQHEIRFHKLRRYRAAYRKWIADEVRFKNALANSSFRGILLIEEGIVKDLNQMMAELIGRESEDIKGSPAFQFYRLEGDENTFRTGCSDLIPGETLEGWIIGKEDQETPVRLTIREVQVDEQLYQALLVEDRTQERLGSKEDKKKLAVTALDAKNLPLTKRERQIAAALLQGLTRQEVADSLYISEDTVKSHISHIYRKLKVRSRVELARKVLGE